MKIIAFLPTYSHKSSGSSDHILRYSPSFPQRTWRTWWRCWHIASSVHNFGRFTRLDFLISGPCIQL
jgi:hypothetical protein